jgi:hypothetical protein
VRGPGVHSLELDRAVEERVRGVLDVLLRRVDVRQVSLEIRKRFDVYGMRVGHGRSAEDGGHETSLPTAGKECQFRPSHGAQPKPGARWRGMLTTPARQSFYNRTVP